MIETHFQPQPLSRKLMALLLSASLTPLTSRVLMSQIRYTVAQIISSPADYDKKQVTVTGVVKKLQHKTSKSDNAYTVFELHANGKYVRVFSWGNLNISNNQTVTVTGLFNKIKKIQQHEFKNEIEAKIVQ
ncbi:MAG: hypothetical protein HY400_03890 [Elusimicrobia bacterium]|nr:hypothetical protein [Elusimicrobiota bacterium]